MKYFLFVYLFFFFQVGFSQNDTIIAKGAALINENRLNEAIAHYNKYLILSKNDEQKALIYLGLADSYKLKLNYRISNNYYIKAAALIKTLNNKELDFLYHVKMAEFYRKRTLFKNAIEELADAEKILKANSINEISVAQYYSRKAALNTEYFIRPDSTLFYANKALTLGKKYDDKDLIFYSTLEISAVFEERKEYKKAITILENLISYASSNNLVQQQSDAQINYTRNLIKDNQFENALVECLKALDFSKKNKLFFGEMLFTDNIRKIYEQLGNMTKAYEYSIKRTLLTEEFYKKEHDKFLFELEEKYKLTEKDKEIRIKTLEIVNNNKALESSRVKLYVSIALFLLAITGAILFAYYLSQTKKRNLQLLALSQENKFLLSEANHRINNNLQLIIILISDQIKKLPNNQQTELKNILKKIDSIATLHHHLYKNPDKSTIDCHKYLKEITVNFNDLFKENKIKTQISIDSFLITTDFAMYLGLLLTELFINSLKHAFGNQDFKEIKLNLKVVNGEMLFQYSDNGSQNKNQKIEPKLIAKLCRQLKINYEINTVNGFSFSFQHLIK